MSGFPGAGVLLARLTDHRQLDLTALRQLTGIPRPDLQAMFDGGAPTGRQLRRLAPTLGLHTADLFAIAGTAVPEDLAPLDAGAGTWVASLVQAAVNLPPERRDELRRLARSLPQEHRTQPVPPPRTYEHYEPCFGAMLLRMLGNRNLGWTGTARTFAVLTGRYWSAATYGMMGHGRKALTPDLLADFAAVLGIPAETLTALTGIESAGATPPDPAVADMAGLIWDTRRLTIGQVRRLVDEGHSTLMRKVEIHQGCWPPQIVHWARRPKFAGPW